MRLISAAVALCAAMGCGASSAGTALEDSPAAASHTTFAGVWRSVTPSFEFIRLSVVSKSSQEGVLGTRLTFSGVAWEGSGRIDADSLVATMVNAGTTQSVGTIVAHSRDGQTLQVQVRSSSAAPLALAFVREN